jgi:hypothetical protein
VIVSHELFMWVVTALAAGICVGWGARDVYLLCKHLPRRGREAWSDRAAWRDQIFGSIIGLVMISFGLYGVFKYHLGW